MRPPGSLPSQLRDANTPGGGALIVGVTNNGEVIGTRLDVDWLRYRLWEISGKMLTVDIAEEAIRGERVLILTAPQAVEPIRVDGRIRWRIGTHCVEIDPTTWHAKRMAVLNYDWSAEESNLAVQDVRPAALAQARDLLRASEEPHALELAKDSDANLLRRLNVVTADGLLTNAGVIAFVGRGDPCLDYIRRPYAGADSASRVRRPERSLLEELVEVFQAFDSSNPALHLHRGLTAGQHREIPSRAAREAIVNGVAHREWGVSEPTLVEHVGRTLRVTSPGGFIGGVTAQNIITHPSKSRNRSLAELLAALRVAEREGIGVDRMVHDMLRIGHPVPEIRELSGPYVRAALVGDHLDLGWIAWLRELRPADESDDLSSLLILRRLLDVGWIDALDAASVTQVTVAEAQGALAKLSRATLEGSPLISAVLGAPTAAEPVWCLTARGVGRLHRADQEFGSTRSWPKREQIASSYARRTGRISSTELGSLTRSDPTNMGQVLKDLEQQGVLEPAWPSRRGKGFYYRYVDGR